MARAGRITTVLAVATGVVFIILWLAGMIPLAAALAGFIPARVGMPTEVVGAVPWLLTPLSATLVHGDWMHLAFNLLMLVICGRLAEQAIGGPALIVLYVVGAYAAALAQWAAEPLGIAPMIGASGAISAVVAVTALLYGDRRAKAIGPISARWVHVIWLAIGWIVIQLLVGLATAGQPVGIAIFAHIGGFVAGLLLARPLLLWRYRKA